MPYADKEKQKRAVAEWNKKNRESARVSERRYAESKKGKQRDATFRYKNRHRINDRDNEKRWRNRERLNQRIRTTNFDGFVGYPYEIDNQQFKFVYRGRVRWDNFHEKFPVWDEANKPINGASCNEARAEG